VVEERFEMRTMSLEKALDVARAHCGFLDKSALRAIETHDPYRYVLIRHGTGRALVVAVIARETIGAIERAGDYVRDVCLPTTDPLFATDRSRSEMD
jgi:hypothetical protein